MESPVSRGGSPIFVRTKWIKAHFSMSGITAVRWYRNPDLATDSLGRAQLTFYNNSTATRLRGDAATLSPEGVIGVFMD